jgi:hypothetical protein
LRVTRIAPGSMPAAGKAAKAAEAKKLKEYKEMMGR